MFFENVEYNCIVALLSLGYFRALPEVLLSYRNNRVVEGMKNMAPLGFYQLCGWANRVTFLEHSFHSFQMGVVAWNGPCAIQPHRVAAKSKRDNKKEHVCAGVGLSYYECPWQNVTDSYLHGSHRGTIEFVAPFISRYLWSTVSSK